MNGKQKIMAHMVASYPTDEIADTVAQAMVDGGVSYFEVQLPFSDPSADGPLIQHACASVLGRGYRVSDGFAFIGRLRERYLQIPVYLMTYANLAYRQGIASFAKRCADVGVSGVIIPDLPFDSDETLRVSCEAVGIESVPVASPSMSGDRLRSLRDRHYTTLYAALRAGITGTETLIDSGNLAFLDALGGESRVLAGFGIRNGEQVRLLAPHVHAVVAGSVFIDLIERHMQMGEKAVGSAVREKALQLSALC